MAEVDGTSTNSYAAILDEGSDIGVLVLGAIKNTGVTNLLTVKYTARNIFSSSEQSDTYVVLPGNVWDFETITSSLLGQNPPFQNVKVEVKSTVGGLHTTYSLRARVV